MRGVFDLTLKERLDKVLDVKSYGYKVNKWIFRSFFILAILWLGVVGFVDGWSSMVGDSWYECPEYAVMDCYNPKYNPIVCDESYCMTDTIPRDTIVWGDKPSLWARSLNWFLLLGFFFALLLNHLLYNRKFWVKKK